jgi:hypothetical protein
MGAGGLTSHLAAGPVNLPTLHSGDMFQTIHHDHVLSARSLPEVTPNRHLMVGGSERALPVHTGDSQEVYRNLKSLSFRAPLFGKFSPHKVDVKTNTKYCNEEIMKRWQKERETTNSGIREDKNAASNEDPWNGNIRRTQTL